MGFISVEDAVSVLNNEGVVAIPTETVYGLAGRVDSPVAIKKIFETKKRPSFDPLIVHLKDIEQAKQFSTDWSSVHQILAEKFWPGSLTIVCKKTPGISDVITAGLDTVGLRCPNHSVSLELLKQLNQAVAAPSANMFSKTSPTSAQHVEEEFLGQVPVIDGGDCAVGLESTICQVSSADESEKICEIRLLRRGAVLPDDLQQTMEEKGWKVTIHLGGNQGVMPGQMKVHYRPVAPLVLVKTNSRNKAEILKTVSRDYDTTRPEWLVFEDQPELVARTLYSRLRSLGSESTSVLICLWSPEWTSEFWMTIHDRLSRASSHVYD